MLRLRRIMWVELCIVCRHALEAQYVVELCIVCRHALEAQYVGKIMHRVPLCVGGATCG